MKQDPKQLRRVTCLWLTAAALPFTPLAAQDAQPVDDPAPVATVPPVITEPIEVPVVTPPPVVLTPAPVVIAPEQPAAETPAPPPAARSATRNAPRTTARAAPARTPTPARAAAPAPASAPATEATLPAEAAAPAAAAPLPAAVPPVALPPADATPPAQQEQGGGSSLLPLLLIAGLAALGALAFFFLRRRRSHADAYEKTAATVAAATVAENDYTPEPELAAAAATETGRPWLDLIMRPRRAGVRGEEALVEFELGVENQGSAPARDVRVSTWMFQAGAAQESEMERALIEGQGESSLSEIEPGADERLETAVTLPTSRVESDAVLPVVVAEARYRLPDGSEGRTAASFAVGVPIGEELASFDVDNPSGLHDDVEAWPLGETEKA